MSQPGGRLLSRRRAAFRVAAIALGAVPLMRGTARAGVSNNGMVEEDWALVIASPDSVNHAPGIKMIMSTRGDLLGYSADYSINYHKEGSPAAFVPGGFGIEVCNPDLNQPTTTAGPSKALLATPGEVLTWTQRLVLSKGTLTFSLWNAGSTTWGFAPGQILTVSTPCWLVNLSSYDPAISTALSGPVWWPSQVASLTMTAVRYFDGQGNLILADPSLRSAYP